MKESTVRGSGAGTSGMPEIDRGTSARTLSRRVHTFALAFAIIATVLLIFVAFAPAAQASCEDALNSYAYDLPSNSDQLATSEEESTWADDGETSSPEPPSIDELSDLGHGFETRSFYSQIDPNVVNVLGSEDSSDAPHSSYQETDTLGSNDSYGFPSLENETSSDYWNSNAFGRYRLSADDYSKMVLYDSGSMQVASAWFDVESDIGATLGTATIVSRTSSHILTSQPLVLGEDDIGELLILTEFRFAEKPKVTAELSSAWIDELSVSWNIQLMFDAIQTPDDLFNVTDLVDGPSMSIAGHSVEVGTMSDEGRWQSRLGLDWSDAGCGDFSVRNMGLDNIAKIVFPKGMGLVDPTIVCTSYYQNSLPGAPFRNTVYSGGSYWLFVAGHNWIQYHRSDDQGVTWSEPTYFAEIYCPQRPGTFDVAVQNNQVAVAWMDLWNTEQYEVRYIDGYITGSSISWNTAIYVDSVMSGHYGWFGGVTLGVDGTAYVCYAEKKLDDSGVYLLGLTTMKKPFDSNSFSEFANTFPEYPILPGSVPFIRPMSVTTGADSVAFTALVGVDTVDPEPISYVITVVSPNGGEEWMRETYYDILWTTEPGIGYVKIELYQNGNPFYVIDYSDYNDGHYEWRVPSTLPTGQYYLRVSDTGDPDVWDESDDPFSIVLVPLCVISPNGGEEWARDTYHDILWTIASGIGYVKIALYQNGNLFYSIDSSDPNDGYYEWRVPALFTVGQYYLRVSDASHPDVWDESDNAFSIVLSATTLRVTSPNGGEEWWQGSTHLITWTTSLTLPGVIELWNVASNQGTQLAPVELSLGQFSWVISSSQAIGDNYKIRIRSAFGGYEDWSDSVFRIVPVPPSSISVLCPNGGETLYYGRSFYVNWTSEGTVATGPVKIALYSEGWQRLLITDETENDGSYRCSWSPDWWLDHGAKYQVRVSSLVDTGIYDYSDAFFSMSFFIPKEGIDHSSILVNVYRPNANTWALSAWDIIDVDCLGSVDLQSVCPGEKDELHMIYIDRTDRLTYQRYQLDDCPEPVSLDVSDGSLPSMSIDMNGDMHVQYASDGKVWEMHTSPGDGVWSDVVEFGEGDVYEITGLSSGEKLESKNFISFMDLSTYPYQYEIFFGTLPLPADVIGPYGDPWSAGGINQDQPFNMGVTDIISPGNGLLYLFQNDFVVPERGTDIVVSHFYSAPQYFVANSVGVLVPYLQYSFPYCKMGDGWQLNLPWIDDTYVHLWSGTRVKIDWDGDHFNNTRGQPFFLKRLSVGYQLDLQDGMRILFDSDGAPSYVISDRAVNPSLHDYKLEYAVNGEEKRLSLIRDTVDRYVAFLYNVDGRLSGIRYDTSTVSFTYSGGLLTGVTDPIGRATSFSYCDIAGFPSMLIDSVILPSSSAGSGRIDYLYVPIDVGSDARAYVVSCRYIPNENYRMYSYTVVDGVITCTTVNDYSIHEATEVDWVGATVYNFDSDAKASTTTYFGHDSYEYPYGTDTVPLKRTVSRYSPDGRAVTSETYYDFMSEPDVFTSYSDSRGNTIYSKDARGHETFASYSNTTTRNAFYRPPQLEKTTSGKIMFDDFNDWHDDGWSKSSGGYCTIGNYLLNDTYDPSCKLRATSSAFVLSKDLTPGESGLAKLIIDCMLEIETTDSDMAIMLTSESGTLLTGIRFCYSTWWNDYYIFYLRSDGIWDKTGVKYSSDTPFRVTLSVQISSGNVSTEFYIDGAWKFTCPQRYVGTNVVKYLKVSQDYRGSVPECVIDNVKVFANWDVTVTGLSSGMFVEIYDSRGNFVERKKAGGPSVTFTFTPSKSFMPHGNIIVRNDTSVINLVDSYREIWGGDTYRYSDSSLMKSAVSRTYSGIDFATTTILDESVDSTKYDLIGAFNFVSDANLVLSQSNYHHDEFSAGVGYHGYKPKVGVNPTNFYVSSTSYIVQFVYLEASAMPIEIGMRYYSTANGWSNMAFWGTDAITLDDGKTEYRRGDMPTSGQWVMLVTKASDIGWSSYYLSGMNFTHLGGDPRYDKTAFTSDTSFGKIRVTGLTAGQRVDIRHPNGTMITSGIATSTYLDLDLYAAGIHAFPLSGYFVFYDTAGQVAYESSVFRGIYPKDSYAYNLANSPFYTNSHVPEGYTGLATGTMQYTDAARTTSMETYMKFGRLSGSTWVENSLVSETKTKDGTVWRATQYEYDQYGNTVKVTDPRGVVMNYCYERSGTFLDSSWMILASTPIGQQNLSARFDYYSNGLLRSETDAKGYVTNYEYDSVGRVTKVTYPSLDGVLVSIDYIYDNVNQIVTYRDAIDTMSKTYYDSFGRVWKEQRYTSGGTSYSYRTYTYGWNGRVCEITDALGRGTHVDYDYFGRIVKAYNSDETAVRTYYDDRNRTVSQFDELGHRKDIVYDSIGRTIRSVQYLGEEQIVNSMTYDDIGNLLTVTDNAGLMTAYTYDNMARLKSVTYPYGVNEVLYYDAASRLERIDRSGTTYDLLYQYDDAGRLLKKYYTNGDCSNYTYDPNGNIVYASCTSCFTTTVTTRSYDEWDRLEEEVTTLDKSSYSVKFTYDTRSNLMTIDAIDSSYVVSYTYDEFNRMKTASLKAGRTTLSLASMNYNTRDQMTSISYGNGVTTSFTLDPTRGWIDRILVSKSSTSLLDLNYQRDATGRTTQVNAYRTYVYDDLGRLTYANDTSAYGHIAYTYDSYGNRKTMTRESTTTTYSYDEYMRLRQAVTGTSVKTFTYDSVRGNLATKADTSASYEFHYDADDRMYLLLQNGGVAGYYTYDAFGRRAKVIEGDVTETTIYAGSAPLVTISGSGNKITKTLHAYANGIHIAKYVSKYVYYYHQDEVGSVRLVTDKFGAVVFDTDYLPFGELFMPDGQEDFLFVDGRASKYAGLISLGARYYDPDAGRFTTPDKVVGALPTPITMNRWVYCHNDPINKVDASGMWPWDNIVNTIVDGAIDLLDAGANLVGDAIEFVADVVVETVETAIEVIETAVDVAVALVVEVVEAVKTVAEIVVAGCEAIKVAWDNLDPGLKQWIVMGLSIAASIALPGIGGVLVSCLIDGTFIDMVTAISTGDWAMLGMCALAFIPGGKALKGLKGLGGLGDVAKVGKKAPKRVAVIGETQARVDAAAAKYGGETMPKLPPGNRMAENRAWINSKMDEGYIIVDIGLDPNKARRGSYYAMELHEILVSRNYQRYYPVP
ncbi:MAG: RHS repeat-associated core domain-containing protein [Candidatus Thermoplasmatota archaeon]